MPRVQSSSALFRRAWSIQAPPPAPNIRLAWHQTDRSPSGQVSALQNIGLAAAGTLVTGNLSGGGSVLGLADGNMTLGSITTAAQAQVYLADFSMLALGGPLDSFDPAPIFGANPVATGGSISIGGPVSTGLFRAAAGTSLSAGAITAQTIEASAGGTATVSGLWSAPSVLLTSNDIDIGASGGIDAGESWRRGPSIDQCHPGADRRRADRNRLRTEQRRVRADQQRLARHPGQWQCIGRAGTC